MNVKEVSHVPVMIKRERFIATTLSLPPDVEKALTDQALEEGVPRSVVAVRLLRLALESESSTRTRKARRRT